MWYSILYRMMQNLADFNFWIFLKKNNIKYSLFCRVIFNKTYPCPFSIDSTTIDEFHSSENNSNHKSTGKEIEEAINTLQTQGICSRVFLKKSPPPKRKKKGKLERVDVDTSNQIVFYQLGSVNS